MYNLIANKNEKKTGLQEKKLNVIKIQGREEKTEFYFILLNFSFSCVDDKGINTMLSYMTMDKYMQT